MTFHQSVEQIEAHFTTKRVTTQRSNYDYVVASLTPEIATGVRDPILKPPEAEPYNALKTALIKNCSI